MDPSTPQSIAAQYEVVESNNFRRVLSHFDDNGKLRDPTMHFDIECQVCADSYLAFTNPEFSKPADRTYEEYTVLPRCGHAFGTVCLQKWIKHYKEEYPRRRNRPVPCPTCRAPIFCGQGHGPLVARLSSHDPHSQAKDIRFIRSQLWTPDCVECQKGGEAARQREVADRARRQLQERHNVERNQLEQRIVSREEALINDSRDQATRQSHQFRALLGQERDARARTRNAWAAANTTLDALRRPLQYATDRADNRNPNFALYGHSEPIEVDFRRVSNDTRASAEDWRDIGARLANLGPRVQGMITAEMEEAEVARTINGHLQAIQNLLQQHLSGGPASDGESDDE
ncbi:hypothetical protein ANO14919_131100 [Xylariales sp. No.14919]|nr:hypothetical protein ANO14919_131100 [Xylariales sp. No.14919]